MTDLRHGDLFDVLPTLAEASVDACVTDPPYGIGFMGREWDTFKPGAVRHPERYSEPIVSDNPNLRGRRRSPAISPSQVPYDYSVKGLREFQAWCEQWGREVFRVLKPGGYILSCGAPRAYHRMACGLEDAGFEVRDCLAWLFGSGFPKSLNLGDGRGTALKPAHEPIVLARKPFKGSVKANVERYGTGALNIDACRIEGLKPEMRAIDSDARNNPIFHTRSATGTGEMSDVGRWPANVVLDEDAAAALDEQTGELVSGGAPESRYADKFRNVYGAFNGGEVENGIGRSIGGASRFYYVAAPDCILCEASRATHDTMSECATTSASTAERRSKTIRQIIDGTVLNPAHASLAERLALAVPSVESLCEKCAMSIALALVETRCSGSPQQASRAFLDSIPRSKSSILTQNLACFAGLWANTDTIPTTPSLSMLFGSVCHAIGNCTRPASHGSASDHTRFLYSAKPSREERDFGCFDLPEHSGGDATDRVDGSAGLNSPRAGAGRTGGARNGHPTVKPVELMRWLVRLVTPPDGLVLDPFMGSGTTGMACRYELRRFIGIEREAEYFAIAQRRIAAVAPLFGEASA